MRTLNLCFVLLLITLASSQSFQLQGKASKPPQPSTPKIPKEFEQFGPPPKDILTPRSLIDNFISCCNYHWTFAIDNSASMAGQPLFKARLIDWFLTTYFFHLVNHVDTWEQCQNQRKSKFAFNTVLNPPPSSYYEFYLKPQFWDGNPPLSSEEPTNFASAITHMINTVLTIFFSHSSSHNHCLILISDGQMASAPSYLVPLYQGVKEYLANQGTRCLCMFCVYVGTIPAINVNFGQTCNSLGAQILYNLDTWALANQLRQKMLDKIYHCNCLG